MLLEKVKNNNQLLSNIINETLRLEAPVQIIQRINKIEVSIDSYKIPANSRISLCIAAANRDPAVFEDPNEFMLDRKEKKILSFGYGPHYCIGSNLAYQQTKIALEELFSYFPNMCPSPLFKSIYRYSNLVRGLQAMPVLINHK